MNENTQKLTFGALLVAVFGVLLVLNRQTGAMLEETFIFLFPIPMVAFSARYGLKDSLPVFVCTVLISIFCGIFSSAFYAVTQSFIGMIYGSCIHAKRDMTKTMLLIMGLSALSNLLSSVVLASLFGMNLQEDIAAMQTGMKEAISRAASMGGQLTEAQQKAFDLILQPDALMRLLIVSMIFMGAVQGFVVCQLSVIILRRLRFPIKKPAPIVSYYPPRWSGILALILFMGYGSAVAMPQTTGRAELIRVALQSGGLFGYMYLLAFGYIAVLLFFRAFGSGTKWLGVVLALLACFILPQLVLFAGAAYISLGLHEWLVRKIGERAGGKPAARS